MRFFAGFAFLLAMTVSADAGGTLTGKQLRSALSGKTIVLSTPLGSMPIRYRGNGTMSGKAARILVSYTGSRADRGRWWIKGNRVCQKWSNWLKRRSYCYSFRKKGSTVHWRRSDGRSGTARIVN